MVETYSVDVRYAARGAWVPTLRRFTIDSAIAAYEEMRKHAKAEDNVEGIRLRRGEKLLGMWSRARAGARAPSVCVNRWAS